MDIRKEMPEEVKNQKTPDGKPRVITEKIPENLVKDIKEKVGKKNGLLQNFLRVSLQIAGANAQQVQLLEKMKNQEQVISSAINHAFSKMKLKKKTEYQFRFSGKDEFIGVFNPIKKKVQSKDEKKA